ncbi:MAG: GNAT family protein [Myxococcota bacterium]
MERAPYRILGDELEVRSYQPADVTAVRKTIEDNREHLSPSMIWLDDFPQSDKGVMDLLLGFRAGFDLRRDYTYGIFLRSDGAFIGGTGLHPRIGPEAFEIGYWIGKDHLRKGHASCVVRMLSHVGMAYLKATRLEIHVDLENEPSLGVPEAQGYVLEGVRRRRLQTRKGLVDSMAFVMTQEDYPQSRAAFEHVDMYDAAGCLIG